MKEKSSTTLSRIAIGISLAVTLISGVVDRARAREQGITVTASFAGKPTGPRGKIDLELNRLVAPSEGRLAIFIGATDVSAFFAAAGTTISYTPSAVPLLPGDHQVSVYLVTKEAKWSEVASFTLRVVEPQLANPTSQAGNGNGHRRFGITPSLTLNLKSQAAESHHPHASRPERATYTDLTVQGSLRSTFEEGSFGMQGQFDIAGSTYQREALRFGQMGNDAPNLDLSSYLMRFRVGKARISAGHVAYNSNRYLTGNLSSRGLMLTVPLAARGDFTLVGLNGTSIVGWDNFFGLSRRKHQIVTANLGLELIPGRPGGLRVETSGLTGSLLPLSGYSQANVNDAEQSKGIGIRVLASDPSQRLQIEGGFARSRFHNPFDPLLSTNGTTVPVLETTRNARYLEAGYAVLRSAKISENRTADLRFNYRHEQVDPLYRSVGAFVLPNRFQNQLEIVGSVAGITATASYIRFNDNLDNIPSIMKSLTRRSGLIIGVPLVSLFGNTQKPGAWLPRVSYILDRTHQFGASLPTNSGFQAPQIPDQTGDNQSVLAEWQSGRLRYGYRFNHSAQNNFGQKREQTKLFDSLHGATAGVSLLNRLDLNGEVSSDSLNALDDNGNKDKDRTDRTTRFALGLNWRVVGRSALAVNVSNTALSSVGDLALRSSGRNIDVDVQWSTGFGIERSRMRKVQGQFFIRYANRYARTANELFRLNNRFKSNTLNTGLSFTFF